MSAAPPTPGAYLKLRREAAGLSLDDVALLVGADPHQPAFRRRQAIEDVERDGQVITADVVEALARAFRFDRRILVILIAIHAGAEIEPPQVCRVCGCSWNDPCVEPIVGSCAWVGDDPTLCTSCEPAALGRAAA